RDGAALAARQRGRGLLALQLGGRELLDEADMAPGRGAEGRSVVIGAATAERRPVGGQVVPLLAGDLARLAADAYRRVGEEPHAPGAGAADGDLLTGRVRAHPSIAGRGGCGGELPAGGAGW